MSSKGKNASSKECGYLNYLIYENFILCWSIEIRDFVHLSSKNGHILDRELFLSIVTQLQMRRVDSLSTLRRRRRRQGEGVEAG